MYTCIILTFLGPKNSFAQEFLGFSIYVSNTTERKDGILCFEDTNSTIYNIPPVFNITCVVHGQFVLYYNERMSRKKTRERISEHAFNDLCEVEVYGNFIFIAILPVMVIT